MTLTGGIAAGLFLLTLLGIILEKRLRIHRTSLILGAAVLAVFSGALGVMPGLRGGELVSRTVAFVDLNFLALLIGLMIITAVLKPTGVFSYLALLAARLGGGHPVRILLLVGLVTAAAAAALDQLTAALLLIPVSIALAGALGLPPLPFLITQVIAANVGGAATRIGAPTNLMIAPYLGVGFRGYLTVAGPIALVVLFATMGLLCLLYREALQPRPELQKLVNAIAPKAGIRDRGLLRVALPILILTILALVFSHKLGIAPSTAAMAGAAALLLARRRHPAEIFKEVDWTTVFFFVGLYVLLGGLAEAGVLTAVARAALNAGGHSPESITQTILWLSAAGSAVVDSVPATSALLPLVQERVASMPEAASAAWWALALGAGFGGMATMLGASANLVAAGIGDREGHTLTYGQFFRVGAPCAVLALIVAHVYLLIRLLP